MCVVIHCHPPEQCMRLAGQCHLPDHHIWVMMLTVVKSCDTHCQLPEHYQQVDQTSATKVCQHSASQKKIQFWIFFTKTTQFRARVIYRQTGAAVMLRTYRLQGRGSILYLTTINYKQRFLPLFFQKCNSLSSQILIHSFHYWNGGMQWCSWLRHCATSWKVAGSVTNGVSAIFC